MDTQHIRVTYRIETAGSIEAIAAKIASDQSTGTFTEVPGETAELKERCAARVGAIRPLPPSDLPGFPTALPGPFHRADVEILFPLDVVGTDIAALLTICLGGVFSIKGLTGIRVVDLDLPPAFIQAHPGPQFGIEGSRRLTGVKDRPLIGTIIKPNLGLAPEESARIAKELVEAGVDFIKDDEKLMDPSYSPVEERVKAIMVTRSGSRRWLRRGRLPGRSRQSCPVWSRACSCLDALAPRVFSNGCSAEPLSIFFRRSTFPGWFSASLTFQSDHSPRIQRHLAHTAECEGLRSSRSRRPMRSLRLAGTAAPMA